MLHQWCKKPWVEFYTPLVYDSRMSLTTVRGRGRPTVSADTAISRLIALSGLDDHAFGQIADATERAVAAWRRGEKTPSWERLVHLTEIVSLRVGRVISLDEIAGRVVGFPEKNLPADNTKGEK
jgi:hypothetical protein